MINFWEICLVFVWICLTIFGFFWALCVPSAAGDGHVEFCVPSAADGWRGELCVLTPFNCLLLLLNLLFLNKYYCWGPKAGMCISCSKIIIIPKDICTFLKLSLKSIVFLQVFSSRRKGVDCCCGFPLWKTYIFEDQFMILSQFSLSCFTG